MPRLPKWLANTTEKLFEKHIHPVTVTGVELLANNLKRVRFVGDLSNTKYTEGNVIEVRVNDTDFRHYTPSVYEIEEGICDVIFYLHNKGPGSRWANSLEVGQEVKIMGPGGKLSFNKSKSHSVIFGDETSLGLCQSMSIAAKNLGAEYLCILELSQEHTSWPDMLGIMAEVVIKSENKETNANRICEELNDLPVQFLTKAQFYLTGNAKSIQQARNFLKSRNVNSNRISTQPYWAVGKNGL